MTATRFPCSSTTYCSPAALNCYNLLTSLWGAGTINLRSLRRVGRVLIRSRELSGTLREDRMGPGLYRPQPDDRLVRLLRTLRPDQILNRAASFALTPGSVPRLHSPTLVTGRVTCQRTGRRGAAVRGPGYILITHRAGEVIGRRGITSRQAGGLRPPGRLSCRSEEGGAGRPRTPVSYGYIYLYN
jgi:hypothetical protein